MNESMNLQHVNVKIFVDGELSVELNRFIELFHEWITRDAIDEMLLDVVDYRHVPNGPSVMLIGLEADYSIDHADGQYGLVYNRKAPLDGTNCDRFLHSLRSAARACLLLESELEDLRFSRHRFELLINDRALAPNNAETRSAFESDLSALMKSVGGGSGFSFDSSEDPRLRVGALVQLEAALELDRIGET
jgi:hypothetical protein